MLTHLGVLLEAGLSPVDERLPPVLAHLPQSLVLVAQLLG